MGNNSGRGRNAFFLSVELLILLSVAVFLLEIPAYHSFWEITEFLLRLSKIIL